MLLDLLPKCQLNCKYCYARANQTVLESSIDINAIVGAIHRLPDKHVTFHGMEPLMTPRHIRDAIVNALPGYSFSMQSNGLLLRGAELQWAVRTLKHVGISWDGFWPLSRYRYRSKKQCQEVLARIRESAQAIETGVIMVITDETLKHPQLLLKSIKELSRIGVASLRLNPVHRPFDPINNKKLAALYIEVYKELGDEIEITTLRDLAEQAQGVRPNDCVFSGCDPMGSTIPVVLMNGKITNCIKGYALHWQPGMKARDRILQQLNRKHGGCKGCPWFSVCHGGCPASAITADGYTRTAYCETWRTVRDYIGEHLIERYNISSSNKP